MSVYFVVHAELSELSPPMTPRLKRNRFPFGNHGSRESTRQKLNLVWPTSASGVSAMALPMSMPGDNCIKLGLPGKSILGDYLQENMTSQRPFLLLRISFPGRPIFIQFVPAPSSPSLAFMIPSRMRSPRFWGEAEEEEAAAMKKRMTANWRILRQGWIEY